jgi:segregation and condensation protein A
MKTEDLPQNVLALIEGQPFTNLPHDLYIPPEALEVFLDTFQGPLDLLLYLIKKENIDILNIPITKITEQYICYVELMKTLNLELAGEYLVMAAMLAEIKSRLLLPRPVETENADETDPRAELIRRLQEYEQIKAAAENLDALPQHGRNIFPASVQISDDEIPKSQPQINFKELIFAFLDVMKRAKLQSHHAIEKEQLSVRERMSNILQYLQGKNYTAFHQLFSLNEGRAGVVVTFIAILELLKQALIEIIQQEPYSPLHIKAVTV